MRPAIDFSINQLTRSASVQSLPNRGMIGDFRYIPMVQPPDPGETPVERNVVQKKKVPDLSLIKEEPEEGQSLQEGSPRTTRPTKRNQWPEDAFGKKMDTISEDDKENNVSKQSRTNETELLVQSCDEELLAQGLYDYR
ncbi:hypothetical protein COOONC_12453 [Cooperia oncophora]